MITSVTASAASLAKRLAADPAFAGIGVAKAAKLAKALGSGLADTLAAGDQAALASIVGARAAAGLVAAWRENGDRLELAEWLARNGLAPEVAAKASRLWGSGAVERLRERPYDLMAVAGWDEVDALARRLGVAADAPVRLVAAVEAALYRRLARRHTWVCGDALVGMVAGILRVPAALARDAVAAAAADRAAVPLGDGWQPAGAAMMEAFVARRLRRLAGARPETVDPEAVRVATAAAGVALDDGQRAAVSMALERRTCLVRGGAGVGKTTVLRVVCDVEAGRGNGVHLLAIAGRAAARMGEATGRPASTLASFLARAARGEAIGPADLVVVDEASMLDLASLHRLLRAIPDGCRLVLVGDEGQLGPVGFGLTLHALVDVGWLPKVRLARIHRQAGTSTIPSIAEAIREGRVPELSGGSGPDGDVVLLDDGRPPTAARVAEAFQRSGGCPGRVKVVSPVKAGEAGTLAVNELLHRAFAGGARRDVFAPGEPVMFGRNDYGIGLRNGSLGLVASNDGGTLSVTFDGIEHRFRGAAVRDVSLAYAVTAHKAQGSQFDTVVVPVIPSAFVDRAIVYTSITRATRRVVLVGRREDLEAAVARPSAVTFRQTGLLERCEPELSSGMDALGITGARASAAG